jgi:sortase (surface protein transpeptidase)
VHAAPAEARVRPDPARRMARGAGELLLTVGFVLLLFVFYEVYVTDWTSGTQQHALSSRLQQQWAAPKPSTTADTSPLPGNGIAFLHIPRLGADYRRAVVEGTTQADLAQGPGHYTGTALPGKAGNLAIAGHRVGKGSPFLDLDRMRPGDAIVVETRDDWFVYRVLGDPRTGDLHAVTGGVPGMEVVAPTDVAVIAPTPDRAGSSASGRYLTLTTCNPKFSARQRLVIHAELQGSPIAKADEPAGPPALHGR